MGIYLGEMMNYNLLTTKPRDAVDHFINNLIAASINFLSSLMVSSRLLFISEAVGVPKNSSLLQISASLLSSNPNFIAVLEYC